MFECNNYTRNVPSIKLFLKQYFEQLMTAEVYVSLL